MTAALLLPGRRHLAAQEARPSRAAAKATEQDANRGKEPTLFPRFGVGRLAPVPY